VERLLPCRRLTNRDRTREKQDVIRALALTPHFEGGYFAETFRPAAATKILTARGERLAMTRDLFHAG
jgi:predicted cupin superfamily sugar epimerase